MPDEHKTHCCSCRADEHLDLGDYTALDCDENYVVSSGPTKKDFTAGTKRSVGLEFLPANSRPIDPMWSGSYSTTLTRDFARLLIQGIQSLMFRKYAASSDTRLDTKSP